MGKMGAPAVVSVLLLLVLLLMMMLFMRKLSSVSWVRAVKVGSCWMLFAAALMMTRLVRC